MDLQSTAKLNEVFYSFSFIFYNDVVNFVLKDKNCPDLVTIKVFFVL